MQIEVQAITEEWAKKATVESKYGAVWHPGVVVVIDDQTDCLESRAEVDALIAELNKAADVMWPR